MVCKILQFLLVHEICVFEHTQNSKKCEFITIIMSLSFCYTSYFLLLGKESGSTLNDPGHGRFTSLRVVLNKIFF